MRRADRLIKLTHFLRSRAQAVTASRIAEEFEVCTRTVYRDIHDLIDSGVPISGEAGVGYIIDKKYYLPPIAFDVDELEAISLGISMVRLWTDDEFAAKANNAFEKIQAVLPAKLQDQLQQITTYSLSTRPSRPWSVNFSELRNCIQTRRKIHIEYSDGANQKTSRTLRPLALIFFSPVWLLASWCEKREDFRNFRLDRIRDLQYCEEKFSDYKDKNLLAYIRKESVCHTNQID